MIHIGEKIKEVFEATGLSVTEFARRIDTSRENVYGIFTRKSIDTDLLLKITQVLDHNFFSYYINPKEVEELKKQLELAQQEIAYLKKINSLLEKDVKKKD